MGGQRSRRPSPAAFVVEKEHEVEFLFCFVLHLLADAEHVRGGRGDGHPVVLAAHARHVGVDDLEGRGSVVRLCLCAHAGSKGTHADVHRTFPRHFKEFVVKHCHLGDKTGNNSPLDTTNELSWKTNVRQSRSSVSQN